MHVRIQRLVAIALGLLAAAATACSSPVGAPADASACSIRAADYDQTCVLDSDCVGVTEGDFCGGGKCTNCVSAAVSVGAQGQYEADLLRAAGKEMICPCPAPRPTRCSLGHCVLGSREPPDAGRGDVDAALETDVDAAVGVDAALPPDAGAPCPGGCDDGEPCTEDFCDTAGVCRHYVLADGTGCADEDVCNGTEVCHLGICTAGTPLDCDDHDPCTADTCDPKTGCAHDVLADGTTCGSNLYCHAGVCGACTPGASCALTPPRVCHVGVVSCATGVAVCTDKNAPSATLCDDGDPCTANDLCDGQGTCAGVPYSCAPPTECQQSSSCDGTGGCAIVNAIAGTVCAGADYCSGDYRHYNWKCDGAGSCRAASTQPCPAASDCQTGGCVDGACLQVVSRAPGTPCAGANACEAYACDGTGSCADLGAVSDGTACPSGICCGGACLDSNSDPANCGICGKGCEGASCVSSRCGAVLLAQLAQGGPISALAVDSTSVYWVTEAAGTVMKVSLSGGAPVQLASDWNIPRYIAVDATSVYWVDAQWSLAVMRVDLDGTNALQLANSWLPGYYHNGGMVLDSGYVYWEGDGSGGGCLGNLFKVPVGGGTREVVASWDWMESPYTIATDGTDVFIVNGGVFKTPLAGGPITQINGPWHDAYRVALDSTYLYVSDSGAGNPTGVFQVAKDGSGSVIQLFASQYGYLGTPRGIAVDGNYVYWADSATGKIARVLKGGGAIETVASGLGAPSVIVFDSTHMYWTDGYVIMKAVK